LRQFFYFFFELTNTPTHAKKNIEKKFTFLNFAGNKKRENNAKKVLHSQQQESF
jgi:hypothetical protein